jgi:hypothetical protein
MCTTTESTVINQEISDLDGLLSDLARRIEKHEPGMAGPVARLLQASAAEFMGIGMRGFADGHVAG